MSFIVILYPLSFIVIIYLSPSFIYLRDREPFGNVQRVLRESLDHLAAAITASAELGKRIDELEAAKKKLDACLEALEKRLG